MKLNIHQYTSDKSHLRGGNLSRYYSRINKKIDLALPHYMFINNLMIFSR